MKTPIDKLIDAEELMLKALTDALNAGKIQPVFYEPAFDVSIVRLVALRHRKEALRG